MSVTARPTATARTAMPPAPTLKPTPPWWADAGAVVAGLSMLVVTALWVANRGMQQLTAGGADTWTSIGRISGLWASDLLLIQVLLMARVPLVERAFGQDRLARWHRWTGFTSFWLMVVHVVFITIGYGGTSRVNAVAELWDMIVTFPGMLLATAGTAALIMVVVTSMRAARRRFRYESWHLLHLYAYLGVGLALPHQLWTGSDFTVSPVATTYWWTLYAVSAGAILVYRIGLPLWRNARHRLVVSHVVPEAPGLTSVYLTGRKLSHLPVRAGQFFLWRFLDGPGWSRSNPYSLSATPYGQQLRITVKDLGDGSARIAGLRPGTRALIEGPFGKLTGEEYHGGPVVLLACGVGITPLLALLGELPYRPGEATLIYRARSERELAFRDELEWFVRHRGVHVVYQLGRRAKHRSWLPAIASARHGDVHALRRMAPDIARSRVYVCGPDEWADAACAAAEAAGVPADRVHTERFAW